MSGPTAPAAYGNRISSETAPPTPPAAYALRAWLAALALFGAVILAYQPIWRAGFIWDDDRHVTQNPLLVEAGGLKRIWCSLDAPQYYPVLFTTWRAQYALWGLTPAGYHWVNLLLHAANAVVLWRLLRNLSVPGAWLAAALFAVHPVNVESVAWVSQLKNTLAMFFFLTSLLCYVKFQSPRSKVHPPTLKLRRTRSPKSEGAPGGSGVEDDIRHPVSSIQYPSSTIPYPSSTFHHPPSTIHYLVSLLLFILALLSKSAVAPLPIVLLLLAWWQRGKICRTDVWRALPFFAAAIGLGLVTYHVEQLRSGPASATPAQSGFLGHIPSAGWTIWFYLGKALLPLHLVPIYPLWQVVSGRLPSWVPALVLVIVALICWRYRRDWGKAALLGLGYFIILLGPVLGFLDIGFMAYSLVADHWQYFAIVGPLGLLAAGIASGFRVQGSKFKVQSSSFKVQSSELVGDDVRSPFGESPSPKGPLTSSPTILLSVVLLVGLGWLTFRQSSIYVDSEHLWRATIASNPGCWEAHSMLADLLKDSGRLDEAIVQYETALESKPDFGRNHALLGNLYRRKGEFERAVAHLEKAVALDPRSMAAHCTLGSILLDQGKVDEGIAQLQLGIANAGPGVSSAAGIVTVGAGTAFSPQRPGLPSAAGITSEGQARRLPYAPGRLAEAHFTVGNAFLFQKGDVKNAIDHFHKAIELRPDYADVYNNLATAVARTGSADPIINHYQAVLEAKPESADARFELGSLLFHQRRPGETIVQLRAALDLRPDFARACDTLAWLLATCPDASYRDGKQAIALAQHAETLTGGKNALALRTLATAYAQAGQFPEAITTAERAERLAIDRADLALANQLRRDLALYQKGQPYRDIQYAGNEQ